MNDETLDRWVQTYPTAARDAVRNTVQQFLNSLDAGDVLIRDFMKFSQSARTAAGSGCDTSKAASSTLEIPDVGYVILRRRDEDLHYKQLGATLKEFFELSSIASTLANLGVGKVISRSYVPPPKGWDDTAVAALIAVLYNCGVSGSVQYRPVDTSSKDADTYEIYALAKKKGFLPEGTTFEVFKSDYYLGA